MTKEIEDIKTLVAEIEIATKNINGRMDELTRITETFQK